MRATKNFIKVEAKKPIKEPKAALKAILELLLLNINSPIKAPTNGPIKKPSGTGIKIPTINPTVVPMAPALLPPYFLVPAAGIM